VTAWQYGSLAMSDFAVCLTAVVIFTVWWVVKGGDR